MVTREHLADYWRDPWDAGNRPRDYAASKPALQARSAFLLSLIERHAAGAETILEVGCNAGRNLARLYEAGHRDLHGVEINPRAIEHLRQEFPDLAAAANLHVGAAEDVLPGLPDRGFDVVYTMAVLVHLHPDGESVFDEIARLVDDTLITIEDERNDYSWRHFNRDYRELFEGRLGLTQIDEIPCEPALQGLSRSYTARVFKR
jgi:SAM-dependent methyltransferase